MFAEMASEGHWAWSVLGLLCVPTLVALNGWFVAAEFSLVAVRRTRVQELVSRNVTGAKAVEHAIDHLDHSIAATQLGITLASIGLGWVGEPALARLMKPLFDFLPAHWSPAATHSAATGVAFFLITFMHVVFGELIPKTVALQMTDRTALWVARPLIWFAWISRPMILIMNGVGNAVLQLFGFRPAESAEMIHSVQELALLIEDTEEAGLLDEDQAMFVQNVFHLSDKHVADCMVTRDKMAALELNMPPETVMEKVRGGAHTRLPVYEGELDNIVGIVNTKDLFYLFSLRGVVVLEDAMYPALFLKPDESVATALRLFRQAKRPMALVRDDTGKIHGLLTLEDILEEIIGDIEDEHDRPTPKLSLRRRLKPGLSKTIKPPAKKN
ncbi:MAG: hemolysin family protein [Gemmataceae bacterium]|nr:hemolysin family protein [Gemmataceae bacterium]